MPRPDPQTTQRLRLNFGDSGGRPGARIVVIHGENLGAQIEIGDQAVVIGRSVSCDLQIPHASVSRQHCRIAFESGAYVLEDLGSTNQTLVNAELVTRIELNDGDQIAVGDAVVKFMRRESLEDRYHQAMVERATVDTLTGLPNRRVWREALEKSVIGAQAGAPLSLAFVDLDHFKRINDELGHLAGDDVLRAVATVLRNALLAGFVGGRRGGEEFAIILPDTPLQQAIDYAEALRHAVEALEPATAGVPRRITASFGVAQWHSRFQTSAEFMRAADAELFRAKAAGRNRVCWAGH
jgi:diguanylate cyclase (GGDEF)-like protein